MFTQLARILGLLGILTMAVSAVSQKTVDAEKSAQVAQPVLVIAGDEEIVFDWTTDRCDTEDIPTYPHALSATIRAGPAYRHTSHGTAQHRTGP